MKKSALFTLGLSSLLITGCAVQKKVVKMATDAQLADYECEAMILCAKATKNSQQEIQFHSDRKFFAKTVEHLTSFKKDAYGRRVNLSFEIDTRDSTLWAVEEFTGYPHKPTHYQAIDKADKLGSSLGAIAKGGLHYFDDPQDKKKLYMAAKPE